MEMGAKVRCQRFGCDAMFTENDNLEGSCTYHDSPIFHDGMKEWSCCKQRSYDFSLFLALPGCKTGKHSTQKPVTKAVTTVKKPTPSQFAANAQSNASKLDCSRCRQGFFCSDHGSQPISKNPLKSSLTQPELLKSDLAKSSLPPKKKIDLNEPQTCKNKGCGKTFKEKDNHSSACEYHPGPTVFHDRLRGWKCCDIHVKEFDEFMTIPPCTKGWHNADLVS